MKRIDFYLDFVSPYAWLAFEQLPRALEGLGYAVRYRPVLLTALLKHHGQLALLDHAPRRDWARRHALWLAHSLDIELDLPAAYPFNPLPLLRLAWASARQGAPNRFVCEMIFRHVWQGGAAADDPARLQALREQLAPARVPVVHAVPAGARGRRPRRHPARRGEKSSRRQSDSARPAAPKPRPGAATARG